MLLDIGGNWNALSYTSIQSIPNMLNDWPVWWVCRPWKNWDIFSFQELCTDLCYMGPCTIMLKHVVMAVDEWHNNGPQDLITLSLCITGGWWHLNWGEQACGNGWSGISGIVSNTLMPFHLLRSKHYYEPSSPQQPPVVKGVRFKIYKYQDLQLVDQWGWLCCHSNETNRREDEQHATCMAKRLASQRNYTTSTLLENKVLSRT